MNQTRLQASFETAVVIGALATIPLTIAAETGERGATWVIVGDWLVWAVFLAEYVVMVSISQDRWSYARRNWLSVVVIVLSYPALPALLALSRLVRLARLSRAARVAVVAARGARAFASIVGRRGFVYVVGVCLFMVLGGAAVLALELNPRQWTATEMLSGGRWSRLRPWDTGTSRLSRPLVESSRQS